MYHDHDIDFARWLHLAAMWHVALESWQWIHQVAAPCNVIRGSGMTCHWIRPVAAPCNVTRSSAGSWHWIRQVAAPYNVAGGTGMTCHGIRPNVRHIGILHLVSILTISPQSIDMLLCTSLRNFIQIGPRSAETEWRHVDFQMADSDSAQRKTNPKSEMARVCFGAAFFT